VINLPRGTCYGRGRCHDLKGDRKNNAMLRPCVGISLPCPLLAINGEMGTTKPQFALALISFGCSQPTETQLTGDSELTAKVRAIY